MKTVIGIIEDSRANFDIDFENLWPLTKDEFRVLTSGFHLAVLTHSSGTKNLPRAEEPPENR